MRFTEEGKQGMKPFPISNFAGGVNLGMHGLEIAADQAIRTNNLVPYVRGILEKRKGASLHLTVSGTIIKVDEIAVYKSGGSTYLIAGCHIAGADKVFYSKDGAAFAELTGGTALSSTKSFSIAILLNKIYIAHGGDALKVSTDGETMVDLTGTLIPTGVERLRAWKDRLWYAKNDGTYNYVGFSNDTDPATYLASNVVKTTESQDAVQNLMPITFNTATEKLTTMLAILHKESVFVIEFTDEVISRDQYSGQCGCYHPKSVFNTPVGLIYRGKDTVYLLVGKAEPTPIGNIIKPIWDGTDIDHAASTTVLETVGVFFDGFGRLAYANSGSSANDGEYWLDLRFAPQEMKWYGDHSGVPIGCYAVDGRTLYAGASDSGKVYKLEQSQYTDESTAIVAQLQTKLLSLDGSEYTTKKFKRYGFAMASTGSGTVYLDWDINNGNITGADTLLIESTGDVFGVGTFGTARFYAGDVWTVYKGKMRSLDRGNFIKYTLEHRDAYNLALKGGLLSYLVTGRVL